MPRAGAAIALEKSAWGDPSFSRTTRFAGRSGASANARKAGIALRRGLQRTPGLRGAHTLCRERSAWLIYQRERRRPGSSIYSLMAFRAARRVLLLRAEPWGQDAPSSGGKHPFGSTMRGATSPGCS